MGAKTGYIDEYGDKSLNYELQGVSVYFIITAIVIDTSNIQIIKSQVESIRKKYTNSPEIKSKKFNDKDFNKRLLLLEELCRLDLFIYSIIVDKRKIWEDTGLTFRNSFFKYVNKLLDIELFRYYPYLELISDEHGDEKFMNGFVNYFNREHLQSDLFKKPSIRFAKSEDEPLIQVADFVSGSLAKYYDPKRQIHESKRVLEIIKPKVLHLREWPETPIHLNEKTIDKDSKFDLQIAGFAMQLIESFRISNQQNNDEVIIIQLITLDYLLFRFKNNPFEYVFTEEIILRIKQRNPAVISNQVFRNRIIANLRDKDILIVSGKNGYKIPCSKSDLFTHFNHSAHIIAPMISRLDRTNRLIKIATENKIDLLAIESFKWLSDMVNSNRDSK